MSSLTIWRDDAPETPVLETEDATLISARLGDKGVRFERWHGPAVPPKDASEEEILAVYRDSLDRLMGETGAGSADVIRLNERTPGREALRQKFLSEHIHTEDEVRFFVHGSGHFVLHMDGCVYDAGCVAGDLISVPAGTRHWFDAGETPDVVALRVFTDTTGWIAEYTGDDIATRFPVTVSATV
ncbi:acireductone dioxygenase [Acetobacter sp. AN02]|uniref:1,2-dihydroxy-3-keto-5-methylthiopentene dioxygenase n=1 Tax=Acetobacter sp. AN02 TaxID=2894186 RepID=UPI0024343A66|nr:cupin domain-containing protein [Acetobacter sp. AN02]MDG6094823.1 acireductone dioxygenase [Acetobacter sp. AN02]